LLRRGAESPEYLLFDSELITAIERFPRFRNFFFDCRHAAINEGCVFDVG
jgi:hypothetical protein